MARIKKANEARSDTLEGLLQDHLNGSASKAS